VGRTGTFIAVDYILHKLDEDRSNDPAIDILHFVREMRGQRMFMVQTEVSGFIPLVCCCCCCCRRRRRRRRRRHFCLLL
jgi:hypothetical protein